MTAHWVEKYLGLPYEDGARGPDKYDCWGLVRQVYHHDLGGRLLPSWGHVRNTMPRAFTAAYKEEAESMEECEPQQGAIAACFRGSLMLHVGIVFALDGRLAVLECNPKSGIRWRWLADFCAAYYKVKFYRDRSLPKQA